MPGQIGHWKGPPPPERTYREFVLPAWQQNANKVAAIDVKSAKELTFAQLEEHVVSLAGALQAIGVASGRRVQFFADSSINALVAQQAAFFCNATVFAYKTCKSTKYNEYRFHTVEADIEYVLTDAVNYDMAVHEFLLDRDCHIKKVILVAGTPSKPTPANVVVTLDQLNKAPYKPPVGVRVREDTLIVSYTSGSTGPPKGAMHSNYSFVASLHALGAESMRCCLPSDRFLLLSSLSYVSGTIFSSVMLAYGGTVILASHDGDADIPMFVDRYQATVLLLLECPMKTLMANTHSYPNRKDMLASLRVVLAGGTVFPEQLRKETTDFFGGKMFRHIFGMTEAFGMIAMSEESSIFPTHVGFIAPNFEAKIVNDEGQPVEVGEPGELLWRGLQMTQGYWKRSTDEDITADGYFATGDVAIVDDKGRLSIVGRTKHLINCMDARVMPTEIENVLLAHPAVREAVVVGIPHAVVKEAPTALVVLDSTFGPSDNVEQLRQDLVQLVASQLSKHKHLHGGVHVVERLERTDTGKYARPLIRKRALGLVGVEDRRPSK